VGNTSPVGASLLAMVYPAPLCRLTHHREQARSYRDMRSSGDLRDVRFIAKSTFSLIKVIHHVF